MRRQTILRELFVFLFFAALTVALTWPMATQLNTTVSDFGDPLLVTFLIDWDCYALLHQPLHLYDAPMFHPGILPLAYSENFIGPALLVLPFYLAGLKPIAVYGIACLLGFTLSGYGAYVLARVVTKNTIASIVGGIFFAFVSYKFDHLPHLQIVFSGFVPLLLAAVIAFWEEANWKRGALVTLALVGNGLTNIYFLLFAAVAIIFTVLVLAIIRPRPWKFYAALAATGIAAMVILYPFLRPYRVVSKHYQFTRSFDEMRSGSATWTNWVVPSRASRLYGDIVEEKHYAAERQLFPGLMIVFLAIIAIVWTKPLIRPSGTFSPPGGEKGYMAIDLFILLCLAFAWATAMSDRIELKLFGHRLLAADSSDVPLMFALLALLFRFRKAMRAWAERSRFDIGAWAAAVWIIVGILGSLGASSFLYVFFYKHAGPFQALRVASRFAIIAYAGLAVWGALGVKAILDRWRRLGVILVALMIFEVVPRIRWEHVRTDTPPVYTWLNKARLAPVVEIPFSGEGVDYQYLLFSTQHHVKLVNGTSGFFPPEWWKLRDADYQNDFDRLLAGLESLGTKLVIVHGDYLIGDRQPKFIAWIDRSLKSGKLAFVRRFDNEVFGDYVFAIPHNLPQWKRYAAPDVPDGAGNLPRQNLERFLTGKSTHNDSITIWTEMPRPYETIKGPLTVRGWAVSPHGVRRVTVFLQNEKLRFDAKPVARPDVKSAYPWMYYDNEPGFELVLPERPKNIPPGTSLMIEVEDYAGRVRRGRHVSFQWERPDEEK